MLHHMLIYIILSIFQEEHDALSMDRTNVFQITFHKYARNDMFTCFDAY